MLGGVIYDNYGLKYLTPTIGLWIPPEDYIRFVKNLKYYLKQDIKQISWKESHVSGLLEQRKRSGLYKNRNLDDFIIGRIADVDVIFLHYKSFDEAREKWNRRKNRINFDNMIVKFNDQNECSREHMQEFLELEYRNKLLFTADDYFNDRDGVVYLEEYSSAGYVVNDVDKAFKIVNITKYLNSII